MSERVRPLGLPRARGEDRLTQAVGDATTEWVSAEVFDAMEDAAFKMRRTLSMVHMHLMFGETAAAFDRIVADTGLTDGDARAIRAIVESISATPDPTGDEPKAAVAADGGTGDE